MRNLALLAALAQAACSTSQQAAVTVACQQDAILQPIAAPVVAGLVPSSAPIVAVDTGMIHPAVVAFCAAQHARAVVVAGQ